MSVLCCRIPDLLIGLAERAQPELAGRPVALLGADERVWAASLPARQSGVCLQMPARQARMRCPDVRLQPLDLAASQAEQDAFCGKLAECELPVESPAWGVAYVDLHTVATTSQAVQPYCADLGKQVRGILGDTLVPSLGWDTGKFTARAAASYATPGHMRLVERSNEERFLQPLSIELLPLPPLALQQLNWLGIYTLGQFAQLPPTAIWQRFGDQGKLALQWARGRDDRPVRSTVAESVPPLALDFDPPVGVHGAVIESILAAVRPSLTALERRLEGCRRLHIDLRFDEGSTRAIDCAFVEPVCDERRFRAVVAYQLQILNWPAEVSGWSLSLVEFGELLPRQLTLFDLDGDRSPLVQLAERLTGRYGPIFFHPELDDPGHPLPERRAALQSFAMGWAA